MHFNCAEVVLKSNERYFEVYLIESFSILCVQFLDLFVKLWKKEAKFWKYM